jgi:hypothetical protein
LKPLLSIGICSNISRVNDLSHSRDRYFIEERKTNALDIFLFPAQLKNQQNSQKKILKKFWKEYPMQDLNPGTPTLQSIALTTMLLSQVA